MTSIEKCTQAVKSGNLGDLNRDCFASALDTLAKSYASEHNVDFHKAYAAILATPLGSQLYEGYDRAPLAPQPAVEKRVDDPHAEHLPSWGRILKAAEQRKREVNHTITTAKAISEVIRERPELYTAYEAESRDLVERLSRPEVLSS